MKRAVAGDTELDVLHLAAAVRHRLHVLGAGGHPHHRPARAAAAATATTVYSGCRPALPPKPPPTWGVTRWIGSAAMPVRRRQLLVDVVRELVRRPDGEAAVGARGGGEAVRLHRRHGDALVDVAAAHDDVGDAPRGRAPDRSTRPRRRCCHGRGTALGAPSTERRPRHRRPTGSGSMSTTRRPRHRRRSASDSANTTATGSPTNRTRSVASGGPGEVVVDLDEPVVRGDVKVVGGPDRDDTGHLGRLARCRSS